MKDDGCAQDHQENGDDQLQTFNHEGCRTIYISLYQRDEALNQGGEGNAQHYNQRREQCLILAAGDFQEDAQCDQNQSA